MEKLKKALQLFLIQAKIGLFTFGGGYAMISVLQHEYVEKRAWITEEEFFNLIAISESTPGPLAINASTYIGYKLAGFIGALFSTLGMCMPSMAIIYIISLFFEKVLENSWVDAAFKGIQVCVAYLIISAGLKLLKQLKKNVFNMVLFSVTVIAVIVTSLLEFKFSSIYYILIGGAIGIIVYLIMKITSKKEDIDHA